MFSISKAPFSIINKTYSITNLKLSKHVRYPPKLHSEPSLIVVSYFQFVCVCHHWLSRLVHGADLIQGNTNTFLAARCFSWPLVNFPVWFNYNWATEAKRSFHSRRPYWNTRESSVDGKKSSSNIFSLFKSCIAFEHRFLLMRASLEGVTWTKYYLLTNEKNVL